MLAVIIQTTSTFSYMLFVFVLYNSVCCYNWNELRNHISFDVMPRANCRFTLGQGRSHDLQNIAMTGSFALAIVIKKCVQFSCGRKNMCLSQTKTFINSRIQVLTKFPHTRYHNNVLKVPFINSRGNKKDKLICQV